MLSKYRTCIIVSCGIICCIALVIGGYEYLPSPGFVPPYEQVASFSRDEAFSRSFLGNEAMQLDILGFGGLRTSIVSIRPQDWAVHPNGQRAYVLNLNKGTLLEYRDFEDLTGTTRVEDIGLDKHIFAFASIVGVSPESILIWLLRKSPELNQGFYMDTVLELSLVKWPSIIAMHSVSSCCQSTIGYDTNLHRLICVGSNHVEIYGLTERRIVHRYDLDHDIEKCNDIVDYNSETNLVLMSSNTWSNTSAVILFSLAKGSVIEVAQGSYAKWGSDGNVYFVRGSTQLWCYEVAVGKSKPIFLATRHARIARDYVSKLWTGNDKSFLAFQYATPLSCGDGYQANLLLMDLQRQEYKVIDKGSYEKIPWQESTRY